MNDATVISQAKNIISDCLYVDQGDFYINEHERHGKQQMIKLVRLDKYHVGLVGAPIFSGLGKGTQLINHCFMEYTKKYPLKKWRNKTLSI